MSEAPARDESELIELLRSIDMRAPDALHRRVRALIADASVATPRRPMFGWLLGAGRSSIGLRLGAWAALIAVGTAAFAVSLGGERPSGLTVREAAALTLRQATAAAPPERPSRRAQLSTAVAGVAFPYWEGRFGWRSTGTRTDRVGGRRITTVFYADRSGRRIGYAIVAGVPATRLSGVVAWRAGTPYRLLTDNGAPVVSWLRDGHMCVVSARG